MWGSKGSMGGLGLHTQVWGGNPQPASPTLLLMATNRLSRVALFSLEGKQEILSMPSSGGPQASQAPQAVLCLTTRVSPTMELFGEGAMANAVPMPLLQDPCPWCQCPAHLGAWHPGQSTVSSVA